MGSFALGFWCGRKIRANMLGFVEMTMSLVVTLLDFDDGDGDVAGTLSVPKCLSTLPSLYALKWGRYSYAISSLDGVGFMSVESSLVL